MIEEEDAPVELDEEDTDPEGEFNDEDLDEDFDSDFDDETTEGEDDEHELD